MSTTNRLRELRIECGLVQAALAVKAGVSPGLIGAIERYGYPPTMRVQRKIAAALERDVGEIWPQTEASVA
jgi:DNA-binding XRE family transcriptional regulator